MIFLARFDMSKNPTNILIARQELLMVAKGQAPQKCSQQASCTTSGRDCPRLRSIGTGSEGGRSTYYTFYYFTAASTITSSGTITVNQLVFLLVLLLFPNGRAPPPLDPPRGGRRPPPPLFLSLTHALPTLAFALALGVEAWPSRQTRHY